jgi:hypothetical protein
MSIDQVAGVKFIVTGDEEVAGNQHCQRLTLQKPVPGRRQSVKDSGCASILNNRPAGQMKRTARNKVTACSSNEPAIDSNNHPARRVRKLC